MKTSPEQTPTGKACAICGQPAMVAHRPFCSDRCREVDLNRWLGGVYTLKEDTDDVVSGTDETYSDDVEF